MKYIAVDARELWDRPDANVVNVENGLLDVRKRVLAPHSPEFLSPVRIPVKYDPAAHCPAWDKFIAEVFPEDTEAVAWEVPAPGRVVFHRQAQRVRPQLAQTGE